MLQAKKGKCRQIIQSILCKIQEYAYPDPNVLIKTLKDYVMFFVVNVFLFSQVFFVNLFLFTINFFTNKFSHKIFKKKDSPNFFLLNELFSHNFFVTNLFVTTSVGRI